MERNLQNYQQFECGLSPFLVTHIQEVKERITDVELVFCNQLFPRFRSISGSLEKILVEARKYAEGEWKKRESILVEEIEQLHLEKLDSHKEIQQLKRSLEQQTKNLVDTEQLLNKSEYEKRGLVENLVNTEDTIAELKEQLRHKTSEVTKEKEMQERQAEKMQLKKKEFVDKYSHLKSEYNRLLKEKGCTLSSKPQLGMMEVEQISPVIFQNKRSLDDQEVVLASVKRHETNMQSKSQENFQAEQANGMAKTSNSDFKVNRSSGSPLPLTKHIAHDSKSDTSSSPKRAASSWRATRVRQESKGVDPHDDFLSTPMELARNMRMDPTDEAQDFPVPAPKDMDFNNSDDETQGIHVESISQQQPVSNLLPLNQGFKYVEPVRKKSERENLKGVECKQCKKFYDAVLPDGGKGNTSNNNMRCEHHDGVSRHRYKYVPPMTPEGFWNIGFESEI